MEIYVKIFLSTGFDIGLGSTTGTSSAASAAAGTGLNFGLDLGLGSTSGSSVSALSSAAASSGLDLGLGFDLGVGAGSSAAASASASAENAILAELMVSTHVYIFFVTYQLDNLLFYDNEDSVHQNHLAIVDVPILQLLESERHMYFKQQINLDS